MKTTKVALAREVAVKNRCCLGVWPILCGRSLGVWLPVPDLGSEKLATMVVQTLPIAFWYTADRSIYLEVEKSG